MHPCSMQPTSVSRSTAYFLLKATHPLCCREWQRAQRMAASSLSSSCSPYCLISRGVLFLGCRLVAGVGPVISLHTPHKQCTLPWSD